MSPKKNCKILWPVCIVTSVYRILVVKPIKFPQQINLIFIYLLLGKVSPQKKLRGGVIFINEIPKNASGKILRKELRRQLANYKNLI